MPIRMEQDSPGRKQPGRSGGSSGNLLKWILLAVLFIFKKPKLAIPLLLLAGVWYFFLGGQEFFQGGVSSDYAEPDENTANYSLGASLSEERFDKAEVFEPLAYSASGLNTLPKSISLKAYAPKPLHQGNRGSCVGWASS